MNPAAKSMTLTEAQIGAIERVGQDVCVVAGPGAGKTTVLIERFAFLVDRQSIDPARILAITFTERAATLIKQRLIRRFSAGFAESPDLRDAIERAWVSTIHGFCARLLRENAIAAGLAPDFTVLEQSTADRMAREAAEQALEEMFRARPAEMRRVFEALDLSTDDSGRVPDLARSLLTVYEAMRVEGLREIPEAVNASGDAFPRAKELAEIVLRERPDGAKHAQQLRDFAARLLALPADLSRDHFAVLDSADFHLNRIGKGRAAIAGRELREAVVLRLRQQWIARWYAKDTRILREIVAKIDAIYRAKKRREAALDFADLEGEAIRLLDENPEIRARMSRRFDHVLMDELQDTNRLQWRLVKAVCSATRAEGFDDGDERAEMARANFFGVGDLNQSIFGFRHADAEVFAEYRAGLIAAGARIDDLRQNHRSVPEVLEAVAAVLDGQNGIETRHLEASRKSARDAGADHPAGDLAWASSLVASSNDAPSCVELMVARGEDSAAADEVEARMVASRIVELENSGVELEDIAILVRTLSATRPFVRALDRAGIPSVVSGGRTFLETREIRDLLLLLAALVNPRDEIALAGVLRSPLVGLSDEELYRLGEEGRRAEFDARFGKLRRIAGFTAPDLLLAMALDECGYLNNLSREVAEASGGGADRARANVEKFLAYIRREHAKSPRGLAELLEDLEALRESQSAAEAPPPEAGQAVRVMTIHAAKGLEFPVVFVGALGHGPDRRKPVIAFSKSHGLGAKWRNPATGKGESDEAHEAISQEMKVKEEAEENRLLYVAMTRAEDRLILSHAQGEKPRGWAKLVARLPVTMVGDAIQPTSAGDHPAPESRMPDALLKTSRSAEPFLETPRMLDAPRISRRDGAAAVTAIAMFQDCPRKWLLGSLSLSESSSRSRRLLAEVGGDALADAPLMFEGEGFAVGAYDASEGGRDFGAEVHRVLAGGDSEVAAAVELADQFRASEWAHRIERASRVEREFDFLFYFEDVVLRGQIDVWFEEAGELVVVDYKTDRLEAPEAYVVQLQLYALALKPYAGRVADRAVLFYLRSGTAVEVAIDEEAARRAVRAFVNAQETLEYPMRAGERCRQCGFLGNGCVGTGTSTWVGMKTEAAR